MMVNPMIANVKHFLNAIFWIVLSGILPKKRSVLLFTGRTVGLFFYMFCRRRVAIIKSEFKKIFPDKGDCEIRKIARDSTIDYCINEIEQVCFQYLSTDNIDDFIEIQGKEVLDQALEARCGVVAVEPHFGAYMMNMPALGYNNYKVSQVAARGNPPPEMIKKIPGLERKGLKKAVHHHRLNKFENLLPVEFIDIVYNSSLRKVFDKLKANEIIAITGTGRGGTKFNRVKLCGREALLSTGPFNIAKRTGAALVPMFVVRGSDSKNRLVVENQIQIDLDGDEESLGLAVQEFADSLTKYIGEYPHHFGMRLWRMKVQAHYDDHPFFTDYTTPVSASPVLKNKRI